MIAPDPGETGGVQQTEAVPNGTQAEPRSLPGDAVMAWAVKSAAGVATEGDTVLLAPAAASIDQFSSYAHRGDAFIDAVRGLLEGAGNK